MEVPPRELAYDFFCFFGLVGFFFWVEFFGSGFIASIRERT